MKLNFRDYTADTICRLLGLRQFCDPEWERSEITGVRMVVMPSFHPELVITLKKESSGVSASIVVAANQIWNSETSQPTKSFQEQFELIDSVFSSFLDSFKNSLAESEIPQKNIHFDGMRVQACMSSEGKRQTFEAHVSSNQSARIFTQGLIKHAWEGCSSPEVKNILASAARYVDLGFPEVLRCDQPSRQRVNLMVFGTPDERGDFLKSVKKRNEHKDQ